MPESLRRQPSMRRVAGSETNVAQVADKRSITRVFKYFPIDGMLLVSGLFAVVYTFRIFVKSRNGSTNVGD